MAIESVLFLSLVIGALAVFAAALAYAERVAGHAPAESTKALKSRTEAITPTYKKAA